MVSLLTLLGFALGWAAPAAAVYVLLAFVGVTSSLAWQLGFDNQATAFGYGVGLVAGYVTCRLVNRLRGRGRDADSSAAPAAGTRARPTIVATSIDPTVCASAMVAMVLVIVATLVSLVRNYSVPAEALLPMLRVAANELGVFNPPALAGALQAAIVAALGYAVFLVGASTMREAGRAARALIAFHVGVTIAVVSPLLQVLFLDPTVRADRGTDSSLGLVAFFQDPHGYAAFLVLAVNVTAAAAIANWQRHRRLPAIAGAVLTGAALIALLLTGSRTGTAIGVATLAATSGLAVLAGVRRKQAVAMTVVASLAAIGLIVVPVIALSAGSGFGGAGRLLRPLDADIGVMDLVEGRVYRAHIAADLIRSRPLWGLGPGGYFEAQLDRWVQGQPRPSFGPVAENVHNYYLQLATDYGVPALLAFCAFWGLVVSRLVGAIRREREGARRSLLIGIVAGVGGLLLFSIVSHPFLVAELYTLTGAVAGLGYAVARRPSGAATAYAPVPRWVAAVLAILLAASAAEIVRLGAVPAARTPRDTGLYGWEEVAPGSDAAKFRWTRDAAWLRREVLGEMVSVPVFVARPDLAQGPVGVTVSVDSRLARRVLLAENGWHSIDIYVPPQRARQGRSANEVNAGSQGGMLASVPRSWKELRPWSPATLPAYVWFEVRVDRTFVPAEVLPSDVDRQRAGDNPRPADDNPRPADDNPRPADDNPRAASDNPRAAADERRGIGDKRRLGVGIGVFEWADDMPPGGIGFHPVEQGDEGLFRWTGATASVRLRPQSDELAFWLLAANPDIEELPLPVIISWNGEEVAVEVLDSSGWTAVRVPVPAAGAKEGVLTIRPGRTWSPSRQPGRADAGDQRELGVAVRGLGESW